jgi:hypothetical protein
LPWSEENKERLFSMLGPAERRKRRSQTDRISSEKTSDLTLGSPLLGLSDFAKDIWQAERLPYNQKSQ